MDERVISEIYQLCKDMVAEIQALRAEIVELKAPKKRTPRKKKEKAEETVPQAVEPQEAADNALADAVFADVQQIDPALPWMPIVVGQNTVRVGETEIANNMLLTIAQTPGDPLTVASQFNVPVHAICLINLLLQEKK